MAHPPRPGHDIRHAGNRIRVTGGRLTRPLAFRHDGHRAADIGAAGQAGHADTAGSLTADAPLPVSDDPVDEFSGSLRHRRVVIWLPLSGLLVLPAVVLVSEQGFTGRALFLVPATVALVGLLYQLGGASLPLTGWWRRWNPAMLTVVVLVGTGTYAVGGMSWLTGLAIAAAALGRFAPSPRVAAAGIGCCAAVGLGVAVALYPGYGNVISAAILPPVSGFFAHSAERRNQLIVRLRETRAELARMAVAEERLRIARDLHDLLGHSLSLIALKAELAGRLVAADPARAAGEIADLETVARRSLTEVRQAVTSYRQPGLAAELAAARRMLTAAGVDCRLAVPATYSLPSAIDTLLAWTVREGATNVVRHSGARHADIRIELAPGEVRAEVADDGTGPAQLAGAPAGSGLAGLAERAARLGGTLLAGPGGRGGFLLGVQVPLNSGDVIQAG